MKELNLRFGRHCFLKRELLKDTQHAVSEETRSTSGQDQKIINCKAREGILEER